MLSKLFRKPPQAVEAAEPRKLFVAVGYPKVGNTWIRLMIGKYLQLAYGLAELPVLDVGELDGLTAAGCRALGTFVHGPIDWHGQTADDLTYDNVIAPYLGSRVLFMTRHPLDILVSLYMHKRFQKNGIYGGSLIEMINDPILGIDKLFKFHRLWAAHYQEIPALVMVRYEDMRAHPASLLADILHFLNEPVDLAVVDQAVEFAAFDNLKAIEMSGDVPKYKSSQFNVFATGDKSNPNAFHVRKGKVGGYLDELEPDVAQALERRISAEYPPLFGYS